MWNLHLLATEYHSRPSSIVGIDDHWAAYQFDMACLQLARYVDHELGRKRSLQSILSESDNATKPKEYAPLRQMGPLRPMKIPDSGVW